MKQQLRIFISVLLICTSPVKGQGNQDSVLTLLKKETTDTVKVRHFLALAAIVNTHNPDSAAVLYMQGLELAQKLSWPLGTGDCWYKLAAFHAARGDHKLTIDEYAKAMTAWDVYEKQAGAGSRTSLMMRRANATGNTGLAYYTLGDYSVAMDYDTKALQMAEDMKDAEGIARYRGNIGLIYWNQGKLEESLESTFKAIKIGEEMIRSTDPAKLKTGKTILARNLGNVGLVYYQKGDYAKALDYLDKSVKMFEDLDIKISIALTLSNMGSIYYYQGDYPRALEHFIKALKIREALGDKSLIPGDLNNIGLVFYEQKDYAKASGYYEKSLKMARELGNKQMEANVLGNLGNMYGMKKDYAKAMDYYLQTIKLGEESGDKNHVARHLGNVGILYQEQGDYTKALDYFDRSLKIENEIGDKHGVAVIMGNLGALYLTIADAEKNAKKRTVLKKAEKFLLRSAVLADSMSALEIVRADYQALSTVYYKMEDYKNSIDYYKKYEVVKDSMYNAEKNKELTRHELLYEFDKKEAAAKAEQLQKDAVVKAESEKQKTILMLVSGGLLLVFIFS
ncbi:MAG: tetratricopeptide repeat protein, partial [Bacteroidia bacterium]